MRTNIAATNEAAFSRRLDVPARRHAVAAREQGKNTFFPATRN
jgi:hypothetical protein